MYSSRVYIINFRGSGINRHARARRSPIHNLIIIIVSNCLVQHCTRRTRELNGEIVGCRPLAVGTRGPINYTILFVCLHSQCNLYTFSANWKREREEQRSYKCLFHARHAIVLYIFVWRAICAKPVRVRHELCSTVGQLENKPFEIANICAHFIYGFFFCLRFKFHIKSFESFCVCAPQACLPQSEFNPAAKWQMKIQMCAQVSLGSGRKVAFMGMSRQIHPAMTSRWIDGSDTHLYAEFVWQSKPSDDDLGANYLVDRRRLAWFKSNCLHNSRAFPWNRINSYQTQKKKSFD